MSQILTSQDPMTQRFFYYSGRQLITMAGLFWLSVGLFLVVRGVVVGGAIHSLSLEGSLALLAVVIGIFKGQMVLRRMAVRNADRILTLPRRSPVYRLFSRGTWVIIVFFSLLGMAIRFSPLPPALRFLILVAVGVALLIGGIHTLRVLPRVQGE